MKLLNDNRFIISLIVIIIFIIGVGGIYLIQDKKENFESNATVSNSINAVDSIHTTNDIISVIKSGKKLQCNFNYADETSSTAGVFYVDGKNMRGEVITRKDIDGEEYDFFAIRKSDETFIWGSAFPKDIGIKTDMIFEEFIKDERNSKYFVDNKAKYNCQSWEVDPEAFIQPPTVKFVAPNEITFEMKNNP